MNCLIIHKRDVDFQSYSLIIPVSYPIKMFYFLAIVPFCKLSFISIILAPDTPDCIVAHTTKIRCIS